jgi:hypothetical protein
MFLDILRAGQGVIVRFKVLESITKFILWTIFTGGSSVLGRIFKGKR